jgi:NADH-quinone oxidoreductase subunit F
VKILTGVEVGKDVVFEELQRRHQAIYVATGTQFPNKAEIPGEDKAGIVHGVSFLREA